MIRIARTLVVITLATAATAAMAADTPWPSSAQQETPLSAEFPNIVTYQDEHRNDVANQREVAGPSSASQEYPLSAEFPGIVTYKQEHRNDTVRASSTPTFPYSVPDEESLAEEGLVSGTNDVTAAVGATR